MDSIELNAAMMAEVHTLEALEAQRASYDKYTPAEEVAIIDAAIAQKIAQKKDGRGGKREGAGRKVGSKDGAPRTRKSIGTYSLQMKISDDLKSKLAEQAEERGVPMPTIAREILEAYFNDCHQDTHPPA